MLDASKERLAQEKANGDLTLSGEDYAKLSSAFESFSNDCNSYISQFPKDSDKELNDINIAVSNLKVPAQYFAQELKSEQKSLTGVMSDMGWVNDIFAKTDIPVKKYKDNDAWQPGEKSLEESLKIYKEKQELFTEKYKNYYKTIMGNEDYTAAYKYKMNMIKSGLDPNAENDKHLYEKFNTLPDVAQKQESFLSTQSMDVQELNYLS